MPIELQERRMSNHRAGVIDDALDLANKCGWRYALAYLIREGVSAETIQRLLKGGCRSRRLSEKRVEHIPETSDGWKGRNTEDMALLFASLNRR